MAHIIGHTASTLAAPVASEVAFIPARDPRVRILLAAVFACAVVAMSSLTALVGAWVVAFGLLAMSGLAWRATLRRMVLMDGFIIFMLVLMPFTVPGDPILTVWGLNASWQGLRLAAEIALTANAVILALMSLVGTMSPVTLGHALHALRCPERLVHLLMFTIRYIDVLRDEYRRLRTAMKVRGFRPGTNMHSYRSMGYLIGMMLVRAMERSERILAAMKCRGFTGRLPVLHDFRLTRVDVIFAAGLVMALCLLLWIDLT